MKRIWQQLLILITLILFTQIGSSQTADLILTNGKIFTSNPERLYAQAIAIRGNKILAVGSNSEISTLANKNTRKIDLKGKTVVPGFNDAHDHLGWTAPVGVWYHYSEMTVPGPTIEAVLDSVSRLRKTAQKDQWLTGFIGLTVLYNPNIRHLLDSVCPDHPVFLRTWWGHGEVVNSKVFTILHVTDHTPNPVGGWFVKDQNGHLAGSIFEHAQMPFLQAWLLSEPNNVIKGLRAYAQEQLQLGITTVQNMNSMLDAEATNRLFKHANLPVRTRLVIWSFSSTKGLDVASWKKLDPKVTRFTYISGIKLLADGTPFEQTAMMKKPYDSIRNWRGQMDIPQEELRKLLTNALKTHTQIMLHIVGDSSLALVLKLMEEIAMPEEWKANRVRLEHNSTRLATSAELQKLNEMGVMMMHTPVYGHSSPLQSHIKRGLKVGISPDGVMNPFLNIMIVTSQMTPAEENITREEAVIAYTRTNAFAEFAENEKGTIAPGMLADLTVLSQDIFTIPTPQLPATKSVMTMINGKIVYQQKTESNF